MTHYSASSRPSTFTTNRSACSARRACGSARSRRWWCFDARRRPWSRGAVGVPHVGARDLVRSPVRASAARADLRGWRTRAPSACSSELDILPSGGWWYTHVVSAEEERAARKARAAARRGRMTVEVVQLGERKPSPYASSTPEERLAAAVRLIEHQQALRGAHSTLPRSAWPGETFVVGRRRR